MPTRSQQKQLFCILGHPIDHSLSPLMYNTAFETLGLDARYEAFDVELHDLSRTIMHLRNNGYVGFNVTIPHKQSIIPLLDSIEDDARILGAVNTVVAKNGAFHGYNTDTEGIRRALTPHKQRIRGCDVLLLGSGGAARAVIYSLVKDFSPSSVCIAARTSHHAETLLKDRSTSAPSTKLFSVDFSRAPDIIRSSRPRLIVNATSIGMTPEVSFSPLPPDLPLHNDQIVFDLIYTPLKTTLIKTAEGYGATVIGGLEMLIQQGRQAFELYTGLQMPQEIVRAAVEEELNKR